MFDPISAPNPLGVNGTLLVPECDDTWVAAIPPGAPEVPVLRGAFRWWYHDRQGRQSFAVDRHEAERKGERKTFVPLTLWQGADGCLTWRRKHPPAPISLYGLWDIDRRPEATILVVEGEKTADATNRLVPDCIVVTSFGGSHAAHKSDWSPLRQRDVVIWPDNDAPGRAYAVAVAAHARTASATSVRIVDVPADWPVGWDLADPLPGGTSVETLRALIKNAGSVGSKGSDAGKSLEGCGKQSASPAAALGFHPSSAGSKIDAPEPAWAEVQPAWLPSGFRQHECGSIWFEHAEETWRWLCSPISVEAKPRNGANEQWGRLVRVRDCDGVWHEWAMPMAELAGAGDGYRAHLFNLGLELAPGSKARDALQRLLTAANPAARARCVTALGWHHDAYVLPDGVIGDAGGERYVLQSGAPPVHAFQAGGSLEGWQEEIGRPASGNSRLIFSVSMAFAASLLSPIGMEGGGIHWRGSSSTGKTTMGEVAGSVCGGGRHSYKTTWRTTENGLEGTAALHNDGLLVLDEIQQVSAEALGQIAYMLANGQGKQRMNRRGQLREQYFWRLLFISNGEIGLADKLKESRVNGGRIMAGQQVRVLDLPADANKGFGVFDHLAGFASGQALADHLKAASAQHYGHPLRAYLRRLVIEQPFEAIRQFVAGFVTEVVPSGADGQVCRAAARFGLIAAGGETARRFGVVRWPDGEAMDVAAQMFRGWLAERGGTEPAEITAGLVAVRSFLEAHGSSRFAPWTEPDLVVHQRVGYARQHEGGMAYYVLPESWRSAVLAGHDATIIGRAMARRGYLKTNDDGKLSTKQRLPDGSERKVYVVLPSLFTPVEGGST